MCNRGIGYFARNVKPFGQFW